MAHQSAALLDPYDENQYFFGKMERDEANQLLKNVDVGTFILRESLSRAGDFSISVRESYEGDHQICHYLIEKKESDDGKIRYNIGELAFVDIPSLINHFRLKPLERSVLIKPFPKQPIHKIIGQYKFDGERTSDLPFDRGEILEVLSKPEEEWWVARNTLGMTGLIPKPYIKIYEEGDEVTLLNPSNRSSSSGSFKRLSTNSVISDFSEQRFSQDWDRAKPFQVPGVVRVVKERNPSIYNKEALRLKKGQLLNVTELLPNGFGQATYYDSNKSGTFPLTHVEWVNTPISNGDANK
uniref:Adapter molecule Crk n=1 Tax=Acrobeloides nanus TaxID=290746 RepID=A0A914D7M0_9BILA